MGTAADQPIAGGGTGTESQRGGTPSGQPSPEGRRDAGTPTEPSPKGGGGGLALPEAWNQEELHPILRDLNPKQLNEMFLTLLQTRIREGSERREEPARREADVPEVDFKAAFDPNNEAYDPETALKAFAAKNYGGLLRDIGERSYKGLYGNFRSQFSDFGEYEQEIDQALSKQDPTQVTDRHILGLYYAAKGKRATDKERSERARAGGGSTTHKPSPATEEHAEEPLESWELEIARTMFPNKADPAAEYRTMKKKVAGGPYELSVPLGEGKKG